MTFLQMKTLYAISLVVWEMEKKDIELDRKDISYVRFIIEGYDGLGTITTLDSSHARVTFMYPLAQKDLALDLIRALQNEGAIREGTEL